MHRQKIQAASTASSAKNQSSVTGMILQRLQITSAEMEEKPHQATLYSVIKIFPKDIALAVALYDNVHKNETQEEMQELEIIKDLRSLQWMLKSPKTRYRSMNETWVSNILMSCIASNIKLGSAEDQAIEALLATAVNQALGGEYDENLFAKMRLLNERYVINISSLAAFYKIAKAVDISLIPKMPFMMKKSEDFLDKVKKKLVGEEKGSSLHQKYLALNDKFEIDFEVGIKEEEGWKILDQIIKNLDYDFIHDEFPQLEKSAVYENSVKGKFNYVVKEAKDAVNEGIQTITHPVASLTGLSWIPF